MDCYSLESLFSIIIPGIFVKQPKFTLILRIIPIEVKSGSSGKMQSMHTFFAEKKSEYGIRTSLENFSIYDRIKVYPLFAIGTV